MTPEVRGRLRAEAERGTPLYAYDLEVVSERLARLRRVFPDVEVSYAVKANPHPAILGWFRDRVETLDISSGGELERAMDAGWPGKRLTFSGPGKGTAELQAALDAGVRELVCESIEELHELDALATAPTTAFLRINPARAPKGFGGRMSGRPSQFGVDEEVVVEALDALELERVTLTGFHIYAGTNSLSVEALTEHIRILADIFRTAHAVHPVRKLVFGAGFGIAYHPNQSALDLGALGEAIRPIFAGLIADLGVTCALELGRWLVGPAGWYVARVIRTKHSRGTDLAILDGGFNHHLAAAGMMGQVIRRNYPISSLTAEGDPRPQTLVGPLCTTIDTLATQVDLPPLKRGDLVVIHQSGAYGKTASPEGFISQLPAREVVL